MKLKKILPGIVALALCVGFNPHPNAWAAMGTECGNAEEREGILDPGDVENDDPQYYYNYAMEQAVIPSPAPGWDGYWHTSFGYFRLQGGNGGPLTITDDGSDYLTMTSLRAYGSTLQGTWRDDTGATGEVVFWLYNNGQCMNGVYIDHDDSYPQVHAWVGERATVQQTHNAWTNVGKAPNGRVVSFGGSSSPFTAPPEPETEEDLDTPDYSEVDTTD